MSNFQARLKFYNGINTAYSENYTCLRIANQEKKPDSTKLVYDSYDIFNKSAGDIWVSAKLGRVSELRNNQVDALVNALKPSDNAYQIIIEELEEAKNNFVLVYNAYYETDKTAKELIDGFVCLDKDFEEIIRTCLTSSCVAFADSDLEKVANIYLYYLDVYEKYTLMQIYQDLLEQLSNSLTSHGRKSYYYDTPKNPLVKKLSREEILDYIRVTATVFCDKEDALTKSHKELTKAYKKGAKKTTDMYEAVSEVNRLTSETSNAGTLSSIAEEMFDFATALELRLESANTDSNDSALSHFLEKLNDFINGVDVFGTEKFAVNEIYIHQYEIDYLNFLFNLLQTTPEKVKAEHSVTELGKAQTKAKQKGE